MLPPALDACGGIDCRHTCSLAFTGSMWPFTGGAFTLCGECYGMHAYIPDRVIIMVGD
jgi:hypothetical protein